jgi:hypothetical protein
MKEVRIKQSAFKSIEKIADYILLEIKMPDTAMQFTDKLLKFGFDLGKNYIAYTLCKNSTLAKRNLHCATFNKKWVFTFTVGKKSIVIHQILWGGSIQ